MSLTPFSDIRVCTLAERNTCSMPLEWTPADKMPHNLRYTEKHRTPTFC